MSGISFSGLLPKDPVQRVTPLNGASTAFISFKRCSLSVMIRERPKTGHAGSSGWIAIRISYFSHTGWIAFKKYTRLLNNFSSSTSLYISNSSLILAIRSGSQPGSSKPLDFSPMDSNMFSGLILSISFWSYAKTVEPSGRTFARSERVQSNTGMKL